MCLEKIYSQTMALQKLLESNTEENREHVIEQVMALLRARGQLIFSLSGACTEDQKEFGKKILEENQRLVNSLQTIRAQLLNDMNQFRQRKKTISRYRRPYAGPTKDGMFLDKRE